MNDNNRLFPVILFEKQSQLDKIVFALLERSPEVDANSAELRAEGGEDCEVGGLVIEVVAATVAEVGRAVERFRGGGRSVNRDILHSLSLV